MNTWKSYYSIHHEHSPTAIDGIFCWDDSCLFNAHIKPPGFTSKAQII